MKSINADVYALMEIVDEAKLARVVSQLDGYDYVISNFGSHTNTSRNPPSALAEAQKMAFVYKTSVITNLNTRALLSQGINTAEDVNHPYYNHWSSGRFPYMMDADVKLGDLTKNVKFILVHAKANTSPVDVSYNRRKAGADVLYDSLKILFPDDHLIMLGDFNDDLDQSITAGFTTTSWNKFTEDNVEYEPITLPLSLAGKKSTVAYNDIIDHVVISNEMKRWYMSSTASILTDVTSLVSNYGSTTSDHYPVFSRYIYCNITAPENIVVNNDEGQCGAVVNYSFTNTQTCGIVTADIESGSFFEAGTHTVTLTSSYGDVATFTITVIDNEKPIISHNGNKNVNTDAGKCGASVLVTATASDNCGGELTVTGSRSDELELDADYPVGSTTITWTVTDINGNLATTEQIINVADDEKPAITPPAAINTNADAGQCYATIISLGTPVTNDNCGIESVTNDAPATFPVGNTTVTWMVKDIYGNIATAEQVVTVTDAQLPIIISCPSVPVQCYNSNNIYTIPQLIASDNCGIESIEFTITGATTRSGNSNNASGTFNIGTSTILWTVTDVNANKTTCQTTVIINSPVISSIPDAYSITPGSAPNTVYIGYAPASSITLHAQVSGGTAPYAYKWTVGTSSGRGFSNASSITVNPTTSSTYYLNVEDVYGCVTNATTKTVNVVDVRCGPKSDKVSVCQLNKGKWTTSCVLSKDVPDLLASGAILGSCSNTPSSVITYAEPVLELESKGLQVLAMPNPSSAFFNIRIQSVNNSERTFVRITDILGRTIEQFQNVPSTHVLRIGDNYKNGVYVVEVIQGTYRKQLKIIKNQ
jgi:endonuclease/exonuclease/phosphatase family metal-dependent hydrolase